MFTLEGVWRLSSLNLLFLIRKLRWKKVVFYPMSQCKMVEINTARRSFNWQARALSIALLIVTHIHSFIHSFIHLFCKFYWVTKMNQNLLKILDTYIANIPIITAKIYWDLIIGEIHFKWFAYSNSFTSTFVHRWYFVCSQDFGK